MNKITTIDELVKELDAVLRNGCNDVQEDELPEGTLHVVTSSRGYQIRCEEEKNGDTFVILDATGKTYRILDDQHDDRWNEEQERRAELAYELRALMGK